jgi:hypothetical protein
MAGRLFSSAGSDLDVGNERYLSNVRTVSKKSRQRLFHDPFVNSVEFRRSSCALQLGRLSRSRLRRKAYVWIDVARGLSHRARDVSKSS